MKKYNERLKELREDRDVTQQYVADLLKTNTLQFLRCIGGLYFGLA